MGLTILEARVYLALAKAGKATIATISKTSKVARPDVYRTLAKMQEKGLVEKILAIPTQFKLIPMKQSLLTLLENKRNEFLEVQEKTTELFLNFKENNSKSTLREDEAQLRLISEQATVRREKGVLDAVQRSFDEVTTWSYPHTALFVDMDDVTEALQRGVKIRVIIDKPDEKILSDIIEKLKKYPAFKIKYLPNAPKALMSVYDNKEAWICTCTQPVQKECPSLWTNNPCLLAILQDYFEILWLTSMEEPKLNQHKSA